MDLWASCRDRDEPMAHRCPDHPYSCVLDRALQSFAVSSMALLWRRLFHETKGLVFGLQSIVHRIVFTTAYCRTEPTADHAKPVQAMQQPGSYATVEELPDTPLGGRRRSQSQPIVEEPEERSCPGIVDVATSTCSLSARVTARSV